MTIKIKKLNYSLDRINSIALGNPEAIARFNKLFIEQTIEIDLPTLKQSAVNKNWKTVAEVAHKMKPSLDIYEINNVLEIIRELSNIKVSPSDEELWLQKIEHLASELSEVKVALQSTL